jgi:2-C-methyl-D-erythritol 4-phosphate cytidylyltransferase
MSCVTALIVAAGEGRRMGATVPKTYLSIGGRPMVLRTLDRFFATRSVERVILVIATADFSRSEAMLRGDSVLSERMWTLQSGGGTRQQSVKRGLEKIDASTELVIIHDGARPFVSSALIDCSIDAAREKGAVVVGVPVRDTIKMVSDDRRVHRTPERNSLWEIQTPQVFRRDLIVEAHDRAAREGFESTDDAMLVERMGQPVFVMDGERTNFKITTPEDVWLAETLIQGGRIP